MHELLLSTPRFDVERRVYEQPGGAPMVREAVVHPGAVVILPLLPDGRMVMIRQVRRIVEQELWELPAGTLDRGETPLQAARRELAEETGYTSSRWRKLLAFYPSPGLIAERMTIFLADKVRPGAASPEEDERIEVRPFTFPQLLRMMKTRSICDAKTLVGLLYWRQRGALAGK